MVGDPLVVDGVRSFRLTDASGTTRRVLLAAPTAPPPAHGYPIVVLLDAEHGFGTLVEGVRLRARRPDATGVGPAVVVGVSSESEGADRRARRTFDYTAWSGPVHDPHAAGLATGGAEPFLRFLAHDVLSLAANRHPLDPAHHVLIGHSLAGLFALWALSAGSTFTHYVAVSPSIWWNPGALRQAFERQPPTSGSAARRVMVTVGEYEQARAPWQPVGDITDDALRRRVDRRMVDNALMSASIVADAGHTVDYHQFEGEDHASVLALSLARALRFALPPACLFTGPRSALAIEQPSSLNAR